MKNVSDLIGSKIYKKRKMVFGLLEDKINFDPNLVMNAISSNTLHSLTRGKRFANVLIL